MHSLDTHLYDSLSLQLGQSTPTVDAVDYWLILQLFDIRKLYNTHSTTGAIKVIQELILHFILTINGSELQLYISIKSASFERSNELFH